MQRGKYARVCVEIDLNKPVLGRVGLCGVWYNVEYEGLHLLCSNCGCYGHLFRQCAGLPVPQPQAQHCSVPEASPEIPAETAATAQTSEHDITLDSATPATGNANPGAKVAAIKCPESAHGDWMSVTRKAWKNPNPNQKKPLENPPKTARTTSGNQGGEKETASKSLRDLLVTLAVGPCNSKLHQILLFLSM